ncbi:IclR family transcriptional regulator [Thermodesulfobacteriota bacterium]
MRNHLIINSIVKTFRLLECFRDEETGFTLTELVRRLNISMGTAQRIARTMESLGYLHRDPTTKAFQLTSKWLPFGYAYLNNLDLREIVQPYLRELNKETGETVNLAVLEDDEIVYIERVQTAHMLRTNVRPGARRPLVCTSIGKAILAFLPDEEREDILNRVSFVKYTSTTILRKDQLEIELKNIREKGCAENYGEMTADVFGMAVPLLAGGGRAVAGINIVIPMTRVSKEKIYREYLPSLIEKGKRISKVLGNV